MPTTAKTKKSQEGELLFDYHQMTSKDKKKIFEQSTTELKSIIKQADSSGKAAWTAGKMLKEIKEKGLYRIRYKLFAKYVDVEFRMTELTANTYIKIHECFDIKEIGDLIVSNLKVIADIQNDKLRREVVKAFSSQRNEDYKVKEVLATVALLDEDTRKYGQNEIQNLVKNVIKKSKAENRNEKKKRRDLVKFGEPLKSVSFIELETLFEKQPINEMGVVGLFCVLFNWMRSASFSISRDILYFKSIKYIQTGFPDACIVCRVQDKKNSNTDLQVEFEYKSFEYLIHKHHLSDKKCHLIICWEDNARSDKERGKSDNVKRLPPILELKDFLETGKINLK